MKNIKENTETERMLNILDNEIFKSQYKRYLWDYDSKIRFSQILECWEDFDYYTRKKRELKLEYLFDEIN